MKKILLLFITCFILFTLELYGQRYLNGQFTMFSYYISVDKNFKAELSPFEGHINVKTDKKQDKITALLIHNFYEITTKILTDSLNIYILPPNNLAEKAKYNDYGYPDISIQKAQRLADSKYFLKIIAYFENNPNDEKGNKLPEGSFKPQVKVSIYLYNSVGVIPMKSATGVSSSTVPIKTSPQFLSSLNFFDITEKTNSETLKDIMILAVNDAIYQLKHKK